MPAFKVSVVNGVLVALGSLALAAPGLAQQGGPPPQGQGAQTPPPGPGGAGGPPRQGGGPGGGGGQGGGGGGRGGGGGGGGGFGGPAAAPNTGVPIFTNLAGGGHATLVIDPPQKKLCYMSYGISGPARLSGATSVTLPAGSGCVDITTEAGQAIIANPGSYTLDIGGATGTLGK